MDLVGARLNEDVLLCNGSMFIGMTTCIRARCLNAISYDFKYL